MIALTRQPIILPRIPIDNNWRMQHIMEADAAGMFFAQNVGENYRKTTLRGWP
jgi:hypothetical protein